MECNQSVVLVLALFLGVACGEAIRSQKCHLPSGRQSSCIVHEVRINPCPEAAENKPCKIRLGSNATLSFDYTPTFSATKAGSHAYKVGPVLDIAFEQMNTDGCLYTKCPVEANKKQVYNYALEIGNQFPASVHQAKVKLWNEDDYHQQCCFKITVDLVKSQRYRWELRKMVMRGHRDGASGEVEVVE